MITEKRDQPYSAIASWIRRKIYFSLIRSIGMCIRGRRSVTSSNDLLTSTTNDAVASEMITNIVSVWIYEHFPSFFLLEVCDWEEILVNLWLLRQDGKHPTGWIKFLEKKIGCLNHSFFHFRKITFSRKYSFSWKFTTSQTKNNRKKQSPGDVCNNSQENTRYSLFFNKVPCCRPATLLKETPAQAFSCKFCEIFRNT